MFNPPFTCLFPYILPYLLDKLWYVVHTLYTLYTCNLLICFPLFDYVCLYVIHLSLKNYFECKHIIGPFFFYSHNPFWLCAHFGLSLIGTKKSLNEQIIILFISSVTTSLKKKKNKSQNLFEAISTVPSLRSQHVSQHYPWVIICTCEKTISVFVTKLFFAQTHMMPSTLQLS